MRSALCLLFVACCSPAALAEMKTWDGRHSIEQIDVSVVYFVPADRAPLPDWRERVDYFCKRIELFHRREFQGQSTLRTLVQAEPFVSEKSTAQLRAGDANFIFFQTLREAARKIDFPPEERQGFPILLVLSEINWRPLDDFYRLKPQDGRLTFEGIFNEGLHFPGAASGGARATYDANRGYGWGLVSADGWRVPYRGSDCVVYHEGCGHTVGLPHSEPPNASVMSLGQYRGWISESWLDKDQKSRLGWAPAEDFQDANVELFTHFRALPEPRVPQPGEPVALKLDWPEESKIASVRVRLQTDVATPWVEAAADSDGDYGSIPLGAFDRPTPVSYRVDAALENGASVELWGYFQVRADRETNPQPFHSLADLPLVDDKQSSNAPPVQADGEAEKATGETIDLLALTDPQKCWTQGEWRLHDRRLESPKQFGARIEIPYQPPPEYRLTIIAEPLDEPHGLLLGQRLGDRRFVVLLNYTRGDQALSALEDVNGQNVGNETTHRGAVFAKNQLSQIIVTARRGLLTVEVDGKTIIRSPGDPDRFSLSDYWKTPRDNALLLGAYDCRYRIYRVSLEPLSGEGQALAAGEAP